MNARNRRGYTLIELVVTVLIIGVLTSIAVPQYLKTVETGKADDAAATVNMIATTNKMFALDHNGFYVYGSFAAACGAGVCPGVVAAAQANACTLVWCKYLADQDWASRPYVYYACDPVGALGGGGCAAAVVGYTKRQATAVGGTPAYSSYAYTVGTTGLITATNAPPPAY